MIDIHKAVIKESKIVAALFHRMWNNHDFNKLLKEFEVEISSNDAAIYLAYIDEVPVAVAQCSLRHDYVEGAISSPVGYLEGIYVLDEYRNKGLAKMLCKSCEEWAIEKGCEEFASDCKLENDSSIKFHLNVGFAEANRIICFTKKLK